MPVWSTITSTRRPNLEDPTQLVSFGTSGHRGTSSNGTFTEAHILAITQAICDYRQANAITGPLFMGKDTHALSEAAQRTALEVLAANSVDGHPGGKTATAPTPVISHAILTYNRGRNSRLADGIVITPSHNPPRDGGFKYNPPDGGPADTDITTWIQNRANELLHEGNRGVKRLTCRGSAERSNHSSSRFHHPLCRRPLQRDRHGCDSFVGVEARCRSSRRFIAALLGSRSPIITSSISP